MTRSVRSVHDDDGSLMLALLASVIVLALTTVVLASVVQTTKTSAHDQRFTRTGEAAESGVQQALFYLNSGKTPGAKGSPVTGAGPGPTTYSWYGQKAAGGERWKIYSTGIDGGVRRTLLANIVAGPVSTDTTVVGTPTRTPIMNPRFRYAAFTTNKAVLRGNDSIRSYDSVTRNGDSGNGTIASNNKIRFDGSGHADFTVLLNHDQYGTIGAQCHGQPCATATTSSDYLDTQSTAATAFMYEALAKCPTPLVPWYASQHGGVLSHNPKGDCYSSLIFDVNTVIDAPATNPMQVYVTGDVTVSPQVSVNNKGVGTSSAMLQIYSVGQGVYVGNQDIIGWAVWAPFADCSGNPSNADTIIYGSMVCDTMTNQGGWQIYYDDALSTTTTATTTSSGGSWSIGSYSEEPTS